VADPMLLPWREKEVKRLKIYDYSKYTILE